MVIDGYHYQYHLDTLEHLQATNHQRSHSNPPRPFHGSSGALLHPQLPLRSSFHPHLPASPAPGGAHTNPRGRLSKPPTPIHSLETSRGNPESGLERNRLGRDRRCAGRRRLRGGPGAVNDPLRRRWRATARRGGRIDPP